jgi:curved DNA-binding protein CbpA/Arc/MetJ-type ribon-helix-helix transcriptional regulator
MDGRPLRSSFKSHMNGQLNEHPLGELIRELCEKGLSGSLRLQHERSKVVVYLEKGRIIYAASNVRSLRLLEHLKKHKLADDSQLADFADKRSDLALAAALSGAGVVRAEVVQAIIENLTCEVLQLALLWTEGKWHFEGSARLDEPVQLEVNTAKVLLESVRKARLKFVSSQFPDPNEIISPGASYNNCVSLTPAEGFLLSRVEADISVSELVSVSGLPDSDVIRALYALWLAGYVKREKWRSALRAQPLPPIARRKTPEATPTPIEPKRSREDDLKDFLGRMDAAVNFYEVLNVSSDTPAADVKQAYYGLARKYHPDRFRGTGENPLHGRLESAFARITQAYETLMDSSLRTAYDAKLVAQESKDRFVRSAPKPTVAAPENKGEAVENDRERAENSFTEGFAALQQGQMKLAVGLLAAAARAVPEEARYRAYYGRALAAHAKTRHSAETELQAAIRLDPSNAAYRVMLAELYRDLGFAKRAQGEAKRALSLEPGNVEARELLRQLK